MAPLGGFWLLKKFAWGAEGRRFKSSRPDQTSKTRVMRGAGFNDLRTFRATALSVSALKRVPTA
jgi:hypothetical protein